MKADSTAKVAKGAKGGKERRVESNKRKGFASFLGHLCVLRVTAFAVGLCVLCGSVFAGCGGLSLVTIKNSPGAVVNHVEARSLAGPATATVLVHPEKISPDDVKAAADAVIELRAAGGAK
jgi:hypothetical protein